MPENLSSFYSERAVQNKDLLRKISRKLFLLSLLRLAFFVVVLVSVYFLLTENRTWLYFLLVFSLFLFIVLVRFYQVMSQRSKFIKQLAVLNEDEAKAANHQFSHFDDGKEYIDPDHFNSYDLDLFGKGSLFQYLNRTTTPHGKEVLSGWLKDPLPGIQSIMNRQQLIAELNPAIDWRQEYSVYGTLSSQEGSSISLKEFSPKIEGRLWFGRLTPFAIGVLVLFSLWCLSFWIYSGEMGWFIIASILQGLFWFFHLSLIKEVSLRMSRQLRVLENMKMMFRLIEDRHWTSDEARQKLEELCKFGKPSRQINQLSRLAAAFDNRNNILVGLVLNLVFCWDVWCSFRYVAWYRKNSNNFPVWFNTLAFYDAANSLANYAFNHPRFAYPLLQSGEFYFEGIDLGHPLIKSGKRVLNHFLIENEQKTIIITGANMSGKSTFLRTIGVNMVLGMAGAPVCATRLVFTPVTVFSNMRTTDSLFDDESYFFAELKRLKQMLDELEQGRTLLVLLDEMLKGTNSADKLYGSTKLIEKLISLKTPAIIATHDLKLTELETQYPRQLKNQCFEIGITDNEMIFDYTLKPGITHVMNASFMMKKMGIIEN